MKDWGKCCEEEIFNILMVSGPVTIAEYMREVLTNPIHGFYMEEETVVGSEGHFITSPEIRWTQNSWEVPSSFLPLSQMFGESVAVWILNEWMKMGAPTEFQLVELGPGKGTLTSDILRTLSKLEPGCMDGVSVHLVEVSSKMRLLQRETLCGGNSEDVSLHGPRVCWYDHIADIPRQFSIFLGELITLRPLCLE